LLVLAISSCTKISRPVYAGYDSFKIQRPGINNRVITGNVKLYNPNNYALQLKKADADVFLNEKLLGHMSLDSLIIMRPHDTSRVPLALQSSAGNLLQASAGALLDSNARLRITGEVKVGRGGVFVTVPVNFTSTENIASLIH